MCRYNTVFIVTSLRKTNLLHFNSHRPSLPGTPVYKLYLLAICDKSIVISTSLGLSLSNLISLCKHENNDIAAAVIQTLYELVDQVNFGFGFPWPFRQMVHSRIPTVKLKILRKAFLKSESRTSVTFKLYFLT